MTPKKIRMDKKFLLLMLTTAIIAIVDCHDHIEEYFLENPNLTPDQAS